MAINNIDVSSISLGKLLQIVYSDGIRLQISEDFKDWEMISRFKAPLSPARQINFMFQGSLNPASVQSRDPGRGAAGSFPQGFQPQVNEYTAYMKMINATIELEYDLWDRARKSPENYAEPLQIVVNSTMTSTKRHLAAQLYGDGTGVLGTVASATVTSPASNQLVFTLSSANAARGGANLFEYNDIVKLLAAAGTASALDTSLATEPAYWKVIDKDRLNNTVTLQGLDSSFAAVATITAISVQPTAGDVFYKFGQQIIPNLSSIADYGTTSDALAGLESLASNDGRVIHGITMSGSNGASLYDCGANPLDVKYIHKSLDNAKIKVGSGSYKWPQMVMSPEAAYTLIESRETDRRFVSIDDNKRGVKQFAYVHEGDTVAVVSSEYCGLKRIYMIPEGKGSGQKVLSYAGSDFEAVKANGNGDEFRMKVGSSGYLPAMQSVMQGYGVLIANHPAAIVKLTNFTVS